MNAICNNGNFWYDIKVDTVVSSWHNDNQVLYGICMFYDNEKIKTTNHHIYLDDLAAVF